MYLSKKIKRVWSPRCGMMVCAILAGVFAEAVDAKPTADTTNPVVPATFPDFQVPGFEAEMGRLRQMAFGFHPRDSREFFKFGYNMAWTAPSAIWVGGDGPPSRNPVRRNILERLRTAVVMPDGYVSCHQHEGLGHSEGWPFPLYTQSGGVGWMFSMAGMPFGENLRIVAEKNTEGWTFENARPVALDDKEGLTLELTGPEASMSTPPISVAAPVAAFIRLKFVPGNLKLRPALEWTTKEQPEFSKERRMEFDVPEAKGNSGIVDVDIPLHEATGLKGVVTGLRVNFGNAGVGTLRVLRFFTAVDTRHNYNNANLVIVAATYFNWTGDVDFLREEIGRLRKVFAWSMEEFQVRKNGVLTTLWPGHDGSSGLVRTANGKKVLRRGYGVGANYWDLMPFGGKDGYSGIYQFVAVKAMADLERQIAAHPEWGIPAPAADYSAEALDKDVAFLREGYQKTFWDAEKGRFVGAVDLGGTAHDYGFTFVNNEAMYYDLASPEQARQIVDWISGKREVPGDTSTGQDIYHWRFGPRSTTRRNLDYYVYSWSKPEALPFGYQVQDGGAVLGFSFHDLMGRLRVNGPDDAWQRLQEILAWFSEVQKEGGYRHYYRPEMKDSRGTLQGGGTAGGLGIDAEFWESILLPQIMTEGFLGLRAEGGLLVLDPRLPSAWPLLKVTNVQYRQWTLDITATSADVTLEIHPEKETSDVLRVELPTGPWSVEFLAADGSRVSHRDVTGGSRGLLEIPGGGVAKVVAARKTAP